MAAKLPNGPPPRPLVARFTERELEFIALRYGQLKGLKEIAGTWGLSLGTVKMHSRYVMAKLNVHLDKHDSATAIIDATKKLVELGYLKLGEQEQ